jgi:hypothetical protein
MHNALATVWIPERLLVHSIVLICKYFPQYSTLDTFLIQLSFHTESTTHVSQCQAQGAHCRFKKSLRRIRSYLQEEKTSPPLQRAILHCLNRWHKQRDIDIQCFPAHICQAIQNQSSIGWQDFLEGLLATDWRRIQQQSYIWKRSWKREQTGLWVWLCKLQVSAFINGNIAMTTNTASDVL